MQIGYKFDMSDLGKLSYYLGIEVEQGRMVHIVKTIRICEKIYLRRLA